MKLDKTCSDRCACGPTRAAERTRKVAWRRLAGHLAAAVVAAWPAVSPGAVVFDNISAYEGGNPSAQIGSTASTPNTFMGDGYTLLPGTTQITGFDIFPVNVSGTSFTGLKITIYVWGSVNTGTVGVGTPAFSNLLATYSLTVPGAFTTGFYFPIEGSPAGSAPGLSLVTPLSIPGTSVGITFNYQGTTDGVTYNNFNNLTSLIGYGVAPSVGSQMFNGYYRNAASEANGNFTSTLRSLGFTFQSLSLRVFGTVTGGNQPPVAANQSVTLAKNGSANITLTAMDPNGDPLTYSVVNFPTNGSLTGSAPNLTYTPNANFLGADAFTFKANDGQTDSAPAVVSLTVLPGSAGLVINPVWDATILNDPNVATITNTIGTALLILESKYADPVTVQVTFAEMGTGLGQSTTYIASDTYASYYAALVADAKTTNDTAALATITGGPSNPVNGGANITCSLPLWRALGVAASPPPGQSDSTVSLNVSLMNLTRASVDPGKYDLLAVVLHELDEVLGSSSGVNRPNISPVDLFRYTAAGARSYTTVGDDAYFSITGGVSDLVQYNEDSTGDYGDFWSSAPHVPVRVQDAFGTPGTTPDLTVEPTILDVIGWDLVTLPPAGPPVFTGITQSGGSVILSWSSVAGRNYQVLYKTDLSQAGWLNLGSPIAATGSVTTASDMIVPGGRTFYQVALLPGLVAPPPAAQSQRTLSGPFELRTQVFRPQPAGEVLPVPPDVPAQQSQAARPLRVVEAVPRATE